MLTSLRASSSYSSLRVFSFFALFPLLASGAFVMACTSDSNGSPPTISDFVLTPATVSVGTTPQINGTMTISDPDGDIAGLSGEVAFPDGTTKPLSDQSVTTTATTLPVTFEIPALPVTTAGNYVVTVQARDAAGNQSMPVAFTITAN